MSSIWYHEQSPNQPQSPQIPTETSGALGAGSQAQRRPGRAVKDRKSTILFLTNVTSLSVAQEVQGFGIAEDL